MKLQDKYTNCKPDGSIHYTNTMGVVVWLIDDETLVSANWCGDDYKNFRHHKINTTIGGRCYFWKNRKRIYLDEMIRVTI